MRCAPGRAEMSEIGSVSLENVAVLQSWHTEARRTYVAHAIASSWYLRVARLLGVIVAALSAFVGGSVFASLATSPKTWLQVVTGVLSVIATVLVAVSTFFGFG